MTFSSSVESYYRDQEDLDLYYGDSHPHPDTLHDQQLAREDRAADHTPAPNTPAWMTTAGASSNGPPSSPAFAPPTAREVGGCRREGGGPTLF